MNRQYASALKSRMIPCPEEYAFSDGMLVLKNGVVLELAGCSDNALAERSFRQFWKIDPEIRIAGDSSVREEGAYKIMVNEEKLRIESASSQALSYALSTLRELAETERGKPGNVHYLLPCGTINDKPSCSFRGIHFCIFPETIPERMERMIRLAAYCKFNYAVIEPWGVFPFESHPEFAWKEKVLPKLFFRHLLAVAQECHITLIPQLNLFGHATFSRVGTAKHAVLDMHPELESLYEPGGWSYCLSNPETRKILTDLVLELHDAFGRPPFFHIGCDEAYDFQTCRLCASADPEKLLTDHIGFFHDLFEKRSARLIMWHDMLLDTKDPRWKGCITGGDERTSKLHEKLPHDILIADWQYGKAPEESGKWPTASFFRGAGFDVVLCPWMDDAGMAQIGAQVKEEQLTGILETTWHTATSGYRILNMFVKASSAAWNGTVPSGSDRIPFARMVRQINLDMGNTSYFGAGHTDLQIPERTCQND